MLEHRGVVNFLLAMIDKPGLSAGDVCFAVTTICFDISVLELFLPLVVGAKVVIVGVETKTDAIALRRLLESQRPNMFQATPSTYRMLIEAGWSGASNIKLLCGGEPLPISLGNQMRAMCKELWNMYGPTEATVWCTVRLMAEEISSIASIGKPIRNTTCYILDKDTKQPVALGEQGVLWVGGVQLARGYRNRAELTAERFIPDPFSKVPNAKMYDTGDLAKYLDNGEILCCGRADYQVKINGYRIELGEIEACLDTHPELKANVVIVYSDPSTQEQRLVAYVVGKKEGSAPAIQELQEHVAKRLPKYMVPSVFVELDKLPLLPNGKVNRAGLPTPSAAKAEITQAVIVSPETEVEKKLVRMCEELLGVSPIGVTTNLFTVGGNSLFALRLRNKVLETFNVEVPVTSILQSGTIAHLDELIEGMLAEPGKRRASVVADNRAQFSRRVQCIVPINPEGTRPPLYLVHPAGGFIFPYFTLAKHLGSSQPIYGIQDISLDDSSTRDAFDKVEEMAAEYVKELLQHRPEGPYYLGGWSLGGQVAFHMAQLLKEKGKTVALVVLIDAATQESYNRMGLIKQNMTKGMPLIRAQVRMRAKYYKEQVPESRLRKGFWNVMRKVLRADNDSDFGSDTDNQAINAGVVTDPSTGKMVGTLDTHMKAAADYRPVHYDGPVLVIRAHDPTVVTDVCPVIRWLRFCPKGILRNVEANHYNIIAEPRVKRVAECILEGMDIAEYAGSGVPRETKHQSTTTVLAFSEIDEYSRVGHVIKRSEGVFVRFRSALQFLRTNPTAEGIATFGPCKLKSGDATLLTFSATDLQSTSRRSTDVGVKHELVQPVTIARGTKLEYEMTVQVLKQLERLDMAMEVYREGVGAPSYVNQSKFGVHTPRPDPYVIAFDLPLFTSTRYYGNFVVRVTFFDHAHNVLFKMKHHVEIPRGTNTSSAMLGSLSRSTSSKELAPKSPEPKSPPADLKVPEMALA
eukprot:Opistho-1_new@5054